MGMGSQIWGSTYIFSFITTKPTFLALADLPPLAVPACELRTLPGRSRESARRLPGEGYGTNRRIKHITFLAKTVV